ncbi:hypothetical protein LSAT2_017618 [Lamellibrachia satsuma]|nr:hypothetical protein LSAT2_017618 [Lamellibrachia satsuma]
MADKANPCPEDTLAVGKGDDEGDVILRIAGSGFPGLPLLLCCSGYVGLAYLGAYVHGGTPLGRSMAAIHAITRHSLQYLRTATEHPHADDPGDNCTSKMANVRGLLVLSLVCLLLCQMMSPSEACRKPEPTPPPKPMNCASRTCGTYTCPGGYICNYGVCGCWRLIT